VERAAGGQRLATGGYWWLPVATAEVQDARGHAWQPEAEQRWRRLSARTAARDLA